MCRRMRNHVPKPHVSAALAQLQRSVTVCALFVLACAAAQLLVFGFVHFTQVRYASNDRTSVQSLSVVGSAPAPVVAGPRREAAPVAPDTTATTTEAAPPPPRALSMWDPALHMASDSAVTIGVISAFSLMALTLLGVAVASGNATPGVERATSAFAWSLVLGLSCIPWADIFTSVPFPGIFGGYTTMTWLSHSVDAGTGSVMEVFCLYLVAPLAVMGGSLLIIYRFRAGVADGVIVTSVSELDERIEREVASIRNRGVQAAGVPRAVAALNRAIGDRPVEGAPAAMAQESARPAPNSPHAGRSWGPVQDRPVAASQAADDDDDVRRPI